MTENLVASWTVDRGRTDVLDVTEAGTAAVSANDTELTGGVLDPTNIGGPYYGDLVPQAPALLELQNAVTEDFTTVFTGFVESYDYDADESGKVTRPTINLVDGLELISAAKMSPGLYGDVPPSGYTGDVYYYTATQCDDRINQVLDEVGWPSAPRSVFSGNVALKRGTYSTGDDALMVISEICDAEFPGVANRYIAKNGDFTFHGRLARFDPTNPDYGIQFWKIGDGAAVAASISDTAQIRGLRYGIDNTIINSASCLPQGIKDSDIAAQLYEDPTSIAAYGKRSWTAENLLTDGGLADLNDDLQETFLFATYRVLNYKDPQVRISQVTFRSLPPEDPRAPALWDLLVGVEISDHITINTTHPGGGGFVEAEYFVEGIHYEVKPTSKFWHDVTLTLDLSPAAYFATNPFV